MKTLVQSLLASAAIYQATAQSTNPAPPPTPAPPTPPLVQIEEDIVAPPPEPPVAPRVRIEEEPGLPREARTAIREVRKAIELGLGAAADAMPHVQQALKEASQQIAMAAAEVRRTERKAVASAADASRDLEGEALEVEQVFKPEAWNGPNQRTPQPPIIVRSSNQPADNSNLQEDLQVMHRILSRSVDKRGQKDSHAMVMGIEVFSWNNSRKPQTMYLEGYGAVFMLNAGFPLKPAPTTSEEKVDKAPDTEWERARKELYSQNSSEDNAFFKQLGVQIESGAWVGGRTARYDSEKVEDLKKDVLEALKHSVNLRDLKNDENVAVIITGPAASTGEKNARVRKRDVAEEGVKERQVRVTTRVPAAQTTMTLKVKKSDAEAYSKGKLTLEEFQKKAVIQSN